MFGNNTCSIPAPLVVIGLERNSIPLLGDYIKDPQINMTLTRSRKKSGRGRGGCGGADGLY